MHRVVILPFQHQCQLSRQHSTRIVQSRWRQSNWISKTFVQRRYLNQDTNAAGVWDPFPGIAFILIKRVSQLSTILDQTISEFDTN